MIDQVQKPDPTRYKLIPRVLIFAVREGQLLLIKGAPTKKTWPNLYNGIGGHVEPGESVLEAAHREFFEETGLKLKTTHLCALITIDIPKSPGIGMYVFKAEPEFGKPTPSEEGTLAWIAPSQMENLPLVEDLSDLIPLVLNWSPGNPVIFGKYIYSDKNELAMTFTQ
jgi:8-oxo-dGTP diphosphatase